MLTYEAARNWSLKTNVKSHQKCEIKTAMFEFDIRQKIGREDKKKVKGSKGWRSDMYLKKQLCVNLNH